MARTPSINGYRTTRKPKVKESTTGLEQYNVSSPAKEINPLNNYSNLEAGTPKVVDGSQGTPSYVSGNRDIVNYAKSPVNTDLEYYNKITNLRNNNNMLVEKYGLQGIRDQAMNELAQQDVLRQQQQRALEEQMRATGIANSGMADTLRSNILSNYNTNVKDIQNDFASNMNYAIENVRNANYDEAKDTINNLLTSYNSEEVLQMIKDADISDAQRSALMNYYTVAKKAIDAENEPLLADGVVKNEDGSYNVAGIVIPKELELFVSSEDLLEKLLTNLNNAPSGSNYETDKQTFIDTITEDMSTAKKAQYEPYLRNMFDEKYKNISDKYFEDIANAREKLDEYKENVSNKASEIKEGLENYKNIVGEKAKQQLIKNEAIAKQNDNYNAIKEVKVDVTGSYPQLKYSSGKISGTMNLNPVDEKEYDNIETISTNDYNNRFTYGYYDGNYYVKNGYKWYQVADNNAFKESFIDYASKSALAKEKEDVLTNGRLSKKANEEDWSSIYVGDTRYSLGNPETVTEVPSSAKIMKKGDTTVVYYDNDKNIVYVAKRDHSSGKLTKITKYSTFTKKE